MRVAWTFEDVHASEVYELEINPQEHTLPAWGRILTSQPNAVGSGILFQGRDVVETMTLSGTLLTEEQYNAFRDWDAKKKQIKITDDLGRVFWAYLTGFSPNRVKSNQYPWRHTFTVQAVGLSWE